MTESRQWTGWGSVTGIAMLSVAVWASGCGDGAVEPQPPDPPRPTSVTVTPATAALSALGATVRLSAQVRDQNGQVMAGASVVWSSSSASVATVDASGLVTAAANGAATVTATAAAASGTAAVTVAQTVNAVNVTPAADTLVVADTMRLSAEAVDANSHAVAGAEFSWASSDTLVAIVDGEGLVTGVAAGEVEITAASSGVTGRAALGVAAPAPTTIAVRPDTVAFTAIGQTMRLAAEVRDQIGRPMEGVTVSWSSADTLVAKVDSAGLVTAAGGGAATITAAAGDATGAAIMTVMQSASSAAISPRADTIALGDTLRLAAQAFDENGHRVQDAEFLWASSDVAVVRVDESGLVTGVGEGRATVTASADEASAAAEITVENPDRAALADFYQATDGPNWANNENWLTDAPLGEWYGVEVDTEGRVVALRLDENGLSGPIPAELGDLANLRYLTASENGLVGTIPPKLGNLANLRILRLWTNALSGPIPAELGNLANLETLDLGGNLFSRNRLSGPIPPALGDLANLKSLNLSGNELSGPLPPELGSLANLRYLNLGRNDFSGPIPDAFLQLDALNNFYIENNKSLCVPGSAEFYTWFQGIAVTDDERVSCNAADVAALTSLFETAGGADWTGSQGWLDGFVLKDWHGVTADSLGRVLTLDLAGNGLEGRLSAALGNLTEMRVLRIGENALSGGLPGTLVRVPLLELRYGNTDLCVPAEEWFQAWLADIRTHEGTGLACAGLSDREVLEMLYAATDGPNWVRNDNWLSDAPLNTWYGVRANEQGAVSYIQLYTNGLFGAIPPELGTLANLRFLGLYGNALTGVIPRGLGNLANLEQLRLGYNRLSGAIPPELGNLAKLEWLSLERNHLEGPLPPELGDLANLRRLYLAANSLSGMIPPELGKLNRLWRLDLASNTFSGVIPPELGNLDLGLFYLSLNDFEGPVPPEFGDLARLRELSLSGNARMSGALPLELANLTQLETIVADDTGLCAPPDRDFLSWLNRIPVTRIARCEGERSMAYLSQAAQSLEYPVPLVANEEALLRVFVTAARPNDQDIPPVRATFYRNGTQWHVVDIAGKSGPIPTASDEGKLAVSANVWISGNYVVPGLEMVIDVDPEGKLDPALGVQRRIPATGRMPIDVQTMTGFDLTVIPFLWTESSDSSILDITEALTANSDLLFETRTLLPVDDFDVTVHSPVLSSSNNVFDLLRETTAIRTVEGASGHYMGTMTRPVTGGAVGVAVRPGRVSFSVPVGWIMAHELGHNMSLKHPYENPSYPSYPNGYTGAWGYDFRDGGRLVPPWDRDIMEGCCWISGFHFTQALRFRQIEGEGAGFADRFGHRSTPSASLLLWGGTDADGIPFLEPAFVVDAPAAMPDSSGAHVITGRTAGGSELFSLSFTMPELADGDGSSSFAFVLPVRDGWEGNLESITLSGPGGSFTLGGGSDVPMVILRNPRTGQVRGILRGPPIAAQAAADAVGASAPALQVYFSRGIPDAEAWRR